MIPTEKKPLVREVCWHQLLIKFISIEEEQTSDEHTTHDSSSFEKFKVIFQSSNNLLMTERYVEHIKSEISVLSSEFDVAMYNYCISLIHCCFQLAREHKSSEYAYLSDYLIHALQAIGIEKELNDMSIDIDN